MFGAPWKRLLNPLVKNFPLITIMMIDSSISRIPRDTGFPKIFGTGHPSIICPMEKYISTRRNPRDVRRRFFSFGVS